ncbi:MAG: response regulator transcription factor [Spirochaetales bacterium]|jgi:DNA-binding response OmpR family regulator|nr:response regulator transcription factor [Spirochaetales bacterium]
MQHKILIIEDEPDIAGMLEYLLRDEGYEVTVAYSGEEGLQLNKEQEFHLIVLDLFLPGIDGLTVCNRIKQSSTIPIIILSARDKDSDVISGLEIGAEDYITKPFSHREFILRVGKILSRMKWINRQSEIKIGDLLINLEKDEVYMGGERINLTPNEYSLLSCLISRAGWVISWQALLKDVWGYDEWEGGREMVKVNIQRLRKKIEPDPHRPEYILNEWGKGYRLRKIEE